MPRFRRRYGKRRAIRKRRVFRRRRRFGRRRGRRSGMFQNFVWQSDTAYLTTQAIGTPQMFNVSGGIGSLPVSLSSLREMFTHVKVKKMIFKFYPAQRTQELQTSPTGVSVFSCINYNPSGEVTWDNIRNNPTCKNHGYYSKIVRTLYPKVQIECSDPIAGTVSDLWMLKKAGWFDLTNPNVALFTGGSIGIGVEMNGNISRMVSWNYNIKYYLSFKKR